MLKSLCIFSLSVVTASAMSGAELPIEVLSDNSNSNRPTRYSIIRENSVFTFSNTLLGQFTSAELRSRTKDGIAVIRFHISNDGKSFVPIGYAVNEPQRFNMNNTADFNCLEKDGIIETANQIQVVSAETTFKSAQQAMLSKLVKAKFFANSCTKSEISDEQKDAIQLATARVLVRQQPILNPNQSRYLACMDEYGFAHEAGLIEGSIRRSIDSVKGPNELAVKCNAHHDGSSAGSYDNLSNTVTLNLRRKANQDNYARAFFHELLHSVGIVQHQLAELLELCCTAGYRCDELQSVSQSLRKKQLLAATNLAPESPLRRTESNFLGMENFEDGAFDLSNPANGSDSQNRRCLQMLSECADAQNENHKQLASLDSCMIALPKTAYSTVSLKKLIYGMILPASVASDCEQDRIEASPWVAERLKIAQTKTKDSYTVAELAEIGGKQGPISWTGPVTSGVDTDAIAARETRRPTRGIASVSTENSDLATRGYGAGGGGQLGSGKNRRDLEKGRATFLIDTAEKAARKVAESITPETLKSRSIARSDAYKEMRNGTKSQFMIAGLKDQPLQFAKIDGLGLGFPNPFFANGAEKTNIKAGVKASAQSAPVPTATSDETLADALAKSRKTAGSINRPGRQESGTTAANEGRLREPLQRDSGGGGQRERSGPTATNGSTGRDHATNDRTDRDQAARDHAAPDQATRSQAAPDHRGQTNDKHSDGSPEPRTPAAQKVDFEKIDKKELVRFLLGAYRRVYDELGSRTFTEALARNEIQIRDHTERPHGALKPLSTFIYRKDLDRLVQTRTER